MPKTQPCSAGAGEADALGTVAADGANGTTSASATVGAGAEEAAAGSTSGAHPTISNSVATGLIEHTVTLETRLVVRRIEVDSASRCTTRPSQQACNENERLASSTMKAAVLRRYFVFSGDALFFGGASV